LYSVVSTMTDSGSWRICWEHKIKRVISILTNSMQHSPIQMLTAALLAKKLWFYRTQKFLPVFTTVHKGSLSLLDKSTPHPPFHFFNINFDCTLSCKCCKWSPSFRFPAETLYTCLLFHASICPATSHFSVWSSLKYLVDTEKQDAGVEIWFIWLRTVTSCSHLWTP
jgi:hypothetical protein